MFVGTILALAASEVIKIRPLWGRLYAHGKGTGYFKSTKYYAPYPKSHPFFLPFFNFSCVAVQLNTDANYFFTQQFIRLKIFLFLYLI
jgi:hypothetical protein